MRTIRVRTAVRPASKNHVRVSTTVSNGSRSSTRSISFRSEKGNW